MIDKILAKIVGTQNERTLKRLRPVIEGVNALEPATKALSDEQLRARSEEHTSEL